MLEKLADGVHALHAPDFTFLGILRIGSRMTRAYLKMGGVYGRPGWHRFLTVLYRNRREARASLERILDEPIERIVLAHGVPIMSRAKETLREGLPFLLG